jgi:hypothetical protein
MLQRVSRSTFLEYLFDHFANECVQASTGGELDRPLDLRHDIKRDGPGTWIIRAEILWVPDDQLKHLSGRKPYQYDG